MKLSCFHPRAGRQIFRARWLMVSPDRILENHCLETQGGCVTGVFPGSPGDNAVDLGCGLIMPQLVNAHVHLELSALKDRLDCSSGFEAWVKDLLAARAAESPENLVAAAEREIQAMPGCGTGAVGEISTLGITRDLLKSSGLCGFFFKEVLGSDTEDLTALETLAPEGIYPPTIGLSLAGHAPHTTAPGLLRQAKALTRGLPFSIHLAESRTETEFINGEKGAWSDFLASRGIDVKDWPVGNKSPVAYLESLRLLDDRTLAVHLIRVSSRDLDILARTGTRVCLCPRSNMMLHRRLPDIEGLLDRGIPPALGTDSLASCSSLDLFDEMAFVRTHYPGLAPETVMAMSCVNGARALGLAMGTLNKNSWGGFLYVASNAKSPADILESLTFNET